MEKRISRRYHHYCIRQTVLIPPSPFYKLIAMMTKTTTNFSSRNTAVVLTVATATTVALLLVTTFAVTFLANNNKKTKVSSSSTKSRDDVDETDDKDNGDDDAVVVVKLDEHDLLLLKFDIRPINTLTWFRGNYKQQPRVGGDDGEDDVDVDDVVSNLRQRAKLILAKNPWLAGKLIKEYNNKYNNEPCIIYPKKNVDDSAIDFDPVVVIDETKSPISRYDTPLEDLERIAREKDLALSKNDTNEPLWKITIVPCYKQPTKYFAIIMSMSHIVVGGSTYYDILTMLLSSNNDDTPIRALNIQRAPNYKEQIQPLEESNFGKEELYFPSTPQFVHVFLFGMLRSFISSKLFQRKVQQIYLLIDNDKINEIKRQQQQAESAEDKGPNNTKTRKVSYISTNDILVSWFYNTSLTTYGFMNVDCRINGIFSPHISKSVHAGNYNRLIYYDTQYDSTTPTLIRRSLQLQEEEDLAPPPTKGSTKEQRKRRKLRYQRAITYDQPLPSYTKCVLLGHAHFGMATNWATFLSSPPTTAQELNIPSKTSKTEFCCKQELHIPLTDVSTFMPYTFTELLIFRPYPGKIAVRIAGYRLPPALRHPPFASDNKLR